MEFSDTRLFWGSGPGGQQLLQNGLVRIDDHFFAEMFASEIEGTLYQRPVLIGLSHGLQDCFRQHAWVPDITKETAPPIIQCPCYATAIATRHNRHAARHGFH